jgi:hypothetical protein
LSSTITNAEALVPVSFSLRSLVADGWTVIVYPDCGGREWRPGEHRGRGRGNRQVGQARAGQSHWVRCSTSRCAHGHDRRHRSRCQREEVHDERTRAPSDSIGQRYVGSQVGGAQACTSRIDREVGRIRQCDLQRSGGLSGSQCISTGAVGDGNADLWRCHHTSLRASEGGHTRRDYNEAQRIDNRRCQNVALCGGLSTSASRRIHRGNRNTRLHPDGRGELRIHHHGAICTRCQCSSSGSTGRGSDRGVWSGDCGQVQAGSASRGGLTDVGDREGQRRRLTLEELAEVNSRRAMSCR